MALTREAETRKRLSKDLHLTLNNLEKNESMIGLNIVKCALICVAAGFLEPLAGRSNVQIVLLAGFLLLCRQMHLYKQTINQIKEITKQLEHIRIQDSLTTYSILSAQRNNRTTIAPAPIQRNYHGPH